MSIKEDYERIRKKYNLPEFEELDRCFDVKEHEDIKDSDEISEEKKIFSLIKEKISSKIDLLTEFFSNIIYLDSESFSLYEAGNLNKEEKNKMFKIFKSLMYIKRSYFRLTIESDEEKDAEFIRMSFERYSSVKEQIIELVDKIKDSWIKDENEEKKYEYFG
jgi:ferric iron reductase protein FhuF